MSVTEGEDKPIKYPYMYDGLGEWHAWLRSRVANADTKTESPRV